MIMPCGKDSTSFAFQKLFCLLFIEQITCLDWLTETPRTGKHG